jgi:hypothetical protein
VYSLAREGRFYDLWQLQAAPYRVIEHYSLGTTPGVVAVAPCADVLRLGREAAEAHGKLLYVPRRPRYSFALSSVPAGRAWTLDIPVVVSPGTYGVWLDGSFPAKVTVLLDGKKVGSARHRLEHPGQYVQVGTAGLDGKGHIVTVRNSGPDRHPGSAANFFSSLDRLILAPTTEDVPVESIDPGRARSLCGRPLDWIEATG